MAKAKGGKGRRMGAGDCLGLGRGITRVACGVAYAMRAVERGDPAHLRVGLGTVVRFSTDVEGLLPARAKTLRGIRKAAEAVGRSVGAAARKGKRLSGKESSRMLGRLKEMGDAVEGLYTEAAGLCRP